MSIIKLLFVKNIYFDYFCCHKLKNTLRNFQPENGQKFKNKPGCPKIVVLIKKRVLRA